MDLTSRLFDVFGTEMALACLALLLITVDLLKGKGRLTGPAEWDGPEALALIRGYLEQK